MSEPVHDYDAGWRGEALWRCTEAALRRLAGADVFWLRHRGHRIAHLANGTSAVVFKYGGV
jgi:hypothetical protein